MGLSWGEAQPKYRTGFSRVSFCPYPCLPMKKRQVSKSKVLTYMFYCRKKSHQESIKLIEFNSKKVQYLLLCGVSFFVAESTLASRTPLTKVFPSSVIN